jgi:mannosyltransferase
MMSRPASPRAAANRPALWGASLAALSVLLSLVRFPPRSLWMDEVWSATSAAVPPWDAILLTLRYDLHPPLYYLQLSLWGRLGQGDAWLFLNSVAWAAAAVWLLTWLISRHHGPAIGVTAGLLLAVAPLSGIYQHELRMYTMLMALTVLAHVAIERALALQPPARALWRMVLGLWLIAYTHGVGPLMAASLGLYALLRARELGPERARSMLVALVVCGFGCLPVLLNSLLRTVGYPRAGWREIAGSLAEFTAGSGEGVALAVGLVGFVLLVGVGAVRRQTRLLTLTVILGPILLVAAISYFVKPIWQTRLFVFALPLGCLIAAHGLWWLAGRQRRLALCLLLILALAGASQTVNLHRQAQLRQDYRTAAALLESRVEPGDTVLAGRTWDLWAIMRYSHGPRWGSPLSFQGEAVARLRQPRQARLGRLGRPVARLLGHESSSDRLVKDDVVYVTGPGLPSTLASSGRVWVVQSQFFGEEAALLQGHELRETLPVKGLRLLRYEVVESP